MRAPRVREGKGGPRFAEGPVKVPPLKSAKDLNCCGRELKQGELVSGVLQLARDFYIIMNLEKQKMSLGGTFWVATD